MNLEIIEYSDAIKRLESWLPLPSSDFPNYFKGIPHDISVNAMEAFIKSVLSRLKVPHHHEGKTANNLFFQHLTEQATALAADSKSDIDIKLYIGGGVVRSLLGYAYKYLHQRATSSKYNSLLPDENYGKSLSIIENMPEDSNKDVLIKSQLRFRNILKTSEFHLKSAAILDQTELLAPFVLGVGSDLDIYYEVFSKDGQPLTNEQIAAGDKIRVGLVNYINALENSAGLRDNHDTIKHSLLPIADVKEYHAQINRTLKQGGSLLDTLAFELTPKNNPRESCFKLPEQYQTILDNFFEGTYEYLAPQKGEPLQKQSIRGLRALLEIPFLNIKDNKILSEELLRILDSIKQGEQINPQAKEQFEKMVRNANFELAHNRPHREKETPLSLGLEIADTISTEDKTRRLVPTFVQKLPLDSNEVVKQGKLYQELKSTLISEDDFIKQYTDNGYVFHGTSFEAGMSVLRGGFVESTKKQGAAAYGPGAYVAKSHAAASEYSTGLVLHLKVLSQNINIITQQEIEKNCIALEQEAREKGYINDTQPEVEDGIFYLLKDRNQYAIDVVIAYNNEYLVVQNLNALKLEEDLNVILDWVCSPLEHWVNDKNALASLNMENFCNMLDEYQKFFDLIKSLGVTVSNKKEPNVLLEVVLKKIQGITYEGHNAFTLAIRKGQADIVKWLLECNPEQANHVISEGDYEGYNALGVAIIEWEADIVKLLLEHNPGQANHVISEGYYQGYNALMLSIRARQVNIVKLILESNPEQVTHVISEGFNRGHNTLTLAILHGQAEIYKLLLKHCPEQANHVISEGKYKGHNAFTLAICQRVDNIAKLIFELSPEQANLIISEEVIDEGHNAFTLAISKKQANIAKLIFERYPEQANHVILKGLKRGHNALGVAIIEGQADIVKLLLECNPEQANHVISEGFNRGHKALAVAISEGQTDIVKLLLEHNPEQVNHVISEGFNRGHNALTLAILHRETEIYKLLLKYCPEQANYVISEGYDKSLNVLAYAKKYGSLEMVELIESCLAENEVRSSFLAKRKSVTETDAACEDQPPKKKFKR